MSRARKQAVPLLLQVPLKLDSSDVFRQVYCEITISDEAFSVRVVMRKNGILEAYG